MADRTTPDTPDTPEDEIPVTDAEFGDPRFTPVIEALGSLTFLSPASPADQPTGTPAPAMPEPVWTRLSDALAREAADRAVATFDNVVPLASGAGNTPRARSRATRWAGGLVAASVAVLAVGVGVQVVRGGAQDAAVTADAPAQVTAFAASPTPSTLDDAALGAAPQLAATAGAPDAGAPAATPKAVPPSALAATGTDLAAGAERSADPQAAPRAARMVKASSTNYTKDALAAQVTTLLGSVNVHSAADAALMPDSPVTLPVAGGFTQTWQALRECMTWLAKSRAAEALVVDRATYEGADAGIIVTPAGLVDPATSPPPTAVVPTPMGILDVWVVKPECQKARDGLVEHVPYTWPR